MMAPVEVAHASPARGGGWKLRARKGFSGRRPWENVQPVTQPAVLGTARVCLWCSRNVSSLPLVLDRAREMPLRGTD
jgi:hypothetical protein